MSDFWAFVMGCLIGFLCCLFMCASSDDIVAVNKAGEELIVRHKDHLYKLVEVRP